MVQLNKTFQRQLICCLNVRRDLGNGEEHLFQLRTRATKRSRVKVGILVHTTQHKQSFTPCHHLITDFQGQRLAQGLIITKEICIQKLCVFEFRTFVKPVVIQRFIGPEAVVR